MAKLLVLEDDPLLELLLVDMFESAGYQVIVALPDDCLAIAAADGPDAIVIGCDGQGAFEPGWQVATSLHQIRPLVPLVMLTTNRAMVCEVGTSSRGRLFVAGLCKPFAVQDLLEIVARAIATTQANDNKLLDRSV